MQEKKILVIGGSGYIGRVVIKDLIKNDFKVTNVDLKIYPDQNQNLEFQNRNERFLKIDLRNIHALEEHLKDNNYVIILGGLVGEPITNKYLDLSKSINENGIINLIDSCDNLKNLKNLIFISTCSNYGITDKTELVNEDHVLKPLSPYAKAKVKIEKHLLSKKNVSYASTVLRFATAFGLSPRMRFDLTVNHFCYSMFKYCKIEVYDADTWRPYCHVKDFSRLIIQVIKSDIKKVDKKVFNAGSNKNNFTKEGIVNLIHKKIPEAKIILKKGGVDRRDYRVSFEKVKNELNFETKYSVENGIEEIIDAFKSDIKNFLKEDALKIRGNYNILEHVK